MELLKFLETQAQKRTVGTLTLGKKNNFREVFLEGDQLYLVGEHFSGRVAMVRLNELGIPGERIGIQKFEAVIQEIDRTKRLLATYLHEKRLLSDAEQSGVALEQILEEVTDTLLRTRESFHFEEGRVPEYLLRCEDLTVRIPVPIEKVIVALRERQQLWARIESIVPSREEVLVLTERGMAQRQAGTGDPILVQVLHLIDGLRDLSSILSVTYFYESHVAAALLRALEEGLVKKTIHPELKGLSTHSFSREDAEKYLPWFKNAVKFGVDELAARERLAVVYEKLERLDDAVIQYNYIGDSLYRMQKAAKAMKAYQKALQLKPDELLVTEKITGIYSQAASEEVAAGNVNQAIQFFLGALRIRPSNRDIFCQVLPLLIQGRRLEELSDLCDWIFAHARKTRSPEVALTALQTVLKELPQNAAFRKKLINIYLDFGMVEPASKELRTLASQYLDRGHLPKAQELIEKIRRLGVGCAETRQLERRFKSLSGGGRKSKLWRVVVLSALALGAYQVWTYALWSRLSERAATADAAQVEARPASLEVSDEERHALQVSSACERFLAHHPLSLWRPEAEELRARLEGRLKAISTWRSRLKVEILDEGRRYAAEGDRGAMSSVLAPLLILKTDDETRDAAAAVARSIPAQEKSAADLLAEAQRLEGESQFEEAHRVYRRLITTYPRSRHVQEIRLPIVVTTIPQGAEVHEAPAAPGQEKKLLGRAPVTVRLPTGGTLELEISAPGHTMRPVELQESDGERTTVVLDRRPSWSARLGGRPESEPTVDRGLLLSGLATGGVVALQTENGKQAWQRGAESRRTLVAAPIWMQSNLLFLWNTGHLELLDVPEGPGPGSRETPGAAADFFLGSLATAPPFVLPRSPLVFLGTRSAHLHAYHRETHALAWSLNVESPPEHIQGVGEDDLVVCTQNGSVQRIHVSPPGIVWKRQLVGGSVAGIAVSGNTVLVATRKNEILFLKSESGDQVHVELLAPGTRIARSRAEPGLYVLTPDGRLSRCGSDTTETAPAVATGFQGGSLHPVPAGVIVLSPDRKQARFHTGPSLELKWSTGTTQPVAAAAGDATACYLLTDDGEALAFPSP